MKVRILPFLTTFAQLSARLKNFLVGWLLVFGIKEGLVECATVCVKSVVILIFLHLLSLLNGVLASDWDEPFGLFFKTFFLLLLTLKGWPIASITLVCFD